MGTTWVRGRKSPRWGGAEEFFSAVWPFEIEMILDNQLLDPRYDLRLKANIHERIVDDTSINTYCLASMLYTEIDQNGRFCYYDKSADRMVALVGERHELPKALISFNNKKDAVAFALICI